VNTARNFRAAYTAAIYWNSRDDISFLTSNLLLEATQLHVPPDLTLATIPI
jgi:hypothetical protein